MNRNALSRGFARVWHVALVWMALVMASPAWAAVSVFEEEEESSGRNPHVMAYVIGIALVILVMWVLCRSSRRNPL